MPTINLGKKKKRDRTFNKQKFQGIYQDKRWKRVRGRKFRANPLCEDCEREGVVRQTEEVHHIRGVDDFPDEAFEIDNLMSLCVEHHKKRDRK